MSSTHDPRNGAALPSTGTGTDDWVPEDREPSAAENNFLSFVLFAFLVLFGTSCFILF